MKKIVSFLLFLLLFSTSLIALEDWAENYGTGSPYAPPVYITGFGASPRNIGDAEAAEAAKKQAMDDLIRKIRVHVQSEVTLETKDDGRRHSSSASTVIQSVSAMSLSGLEFLEDHDRRYQYALAYANVMQLGNLYIDQGRELITGITKNYQAGQDALSTGRNEDALNLFVEILPAFPGLYECRAVYRGIFSGMQTGSFLEKIDNEKFSDIEQVYQLEQDIKNLINRLESGPSQSLEGALNTLITMLEMQNVRGGDFSVSSLLYQDSDFSSAFGNYISHRLEPMLQSRLATWGRNVVVRGTYWEKGDEVEIILVAQAVDSGKKLGSAYVDLPKFLIPHDYEIKPRNFEEALKTQQQIADGAVTDGGLTIEMWTNRGRGEDVIVYSENEILQIYFRANQPAFLQLTYNLATGEKVMLEEAFYIGIDKVNQVVRYPYAFEIVPPLGVERLMVTAYSVKPPAPDIVPEIIDGEEYQVFKTTEAVVKLTRGLRRKTPEGDEIKTGEAFLTITTVPN